MRLQNAPLVLLALGFVILGTLGLKWADTQALKGASPGSGAPESGGVVVNHVETVTHSANVQAAGDYHIEAQLSNQDTIVLYIYGAKEKQLFPIPILTAEAGMEASLVITGEGIEPLVFAARPVSTDPQGESSRFVGKLGRTVAAMQAGLSLSIPIEGKTYRLQWRPEHLLPGAVQPTRPRCHRL
jgi:hypothetical protein